MIFETAVIIGFGCLLVIALIQASQIGKLNRQIDRCFKLIEGRPENWKHEHLEKTVDRLHEKYEALYKEIGELESKAFKNTLRAKDDMQCELNIVYDQLHTFAEEMGYYISKAPSKYKVTKKD